jgi:transcriptional regulator with XRE-family HTH domain
MQIAEEIRALRQKAGLTQKEIAAAINRSQAHVSHLENHPANNPRPSADIVAGITKLKRRYARRLAAPTRMDS